AMLGERGVHMLDAPVSGGVKKAEQGTLAIMVGGEATIFERARPVLEQIGTQILHLGDLGSGHTVKALNNLISATTLSITAEAMTVGVKMGVDAEKMLAAINAGSGRSASSELKFPQQVLSGKFEPGFSLALMSKDLGIALDMANDNQVPVWIGAAVHELWKLGVAQGHGNQDHTAIVRLIEGFAQAQIRAASLVREGVHSS
ncbi:MAG TPA: NAD(P)-dependent oxidoreductase, partial [Burkholderiaceae bacterium]|nr:NAD(P)-dependent oxidoreductase [Burkholderiaceae bacterium]